MPDKLARLTAIGFVPIGAWQLFDQGLTFEIEDRFAKLKNVLYAFAVDGSLVYVGKTNILLRDRLQRYKTPAKSTLKGGSTNFKNNRNILQCLRSWKVVKIYVLHKEVPQEHGGFLVNFAASLEDSLVSNLVPPWNGRQQALQENIKNTVHSASIASEPVAVAAKPGSRVTAATFRAALGHLLAAATNSGGEYIDIQAGQLHRRVDGYPGPKHSMPVCCDAMRNAMMEGDSVVAAPPRGRGATLTIRYRFPRLVKP